MGCATYIKTSGGMARARKAKVKSAVFYKNGKSSLMEASGTTEIVEITQTMSAPAYMYQNGTVKSIVFHAWGVNTMYYTANGTQVVRTIVDSGGHTLSTDYYEISGDTTVLITVEGSTRSINIDGTVGYLAVPVSTPVYITYYGSTIGAGRRLNL